MWDMISFIIYAWDQTNAVRSGENELWSGTETDINCEVTAVIQRK